MLRQFIAVHPRHLDIDNGRSEVFAQRRAQRLLTAGDANKLSAEGGEGSLHRHKVGFDVINYEHLLPACGLGNLDREALSRRAGDVCALCPLLSECFRRIRGFCCAAGPFPRVLTGRLHSGRSVSRLHLTFARIAK